MKGSGKIYITIKFFRIMTDIQFGICGDLDWHNTSAEDNPLVTLKKEGVKELIYELNREPKEEEELFSEYKELEEEIEKLLRLGTLKEREGKVYVNFTFLDEKDNELMFDVCEDYVEYLVEKIISKEETIATALSRYENDRVEKEKLAFFIIGCYFLDWGSLTFFREWDIANNLKPQPGGNEYVLWGEKQDEGMLKEIYWGGHMIPDMDYIFQTFGDHHSDTKRDTLPDILHRFHDFDFPGGEEYRSLLFQKRKDLASELAEIISLVGKDGINAEELEESIGNPSSKKHISLLEKLHYLEEEEGTYYLSIPYFTEEDVEMIADCIEPFVPVLKNWLDDNWEGLKEDLKETMPMKNGVPFDEFFIQAWHYVFGSVNKKLAKKGFIYDTYLEGSKHKGYLPGVGEKEVLDSLEDMVTELS